MAIIVRSICNIVKFYAGKAGFTTADFSGHSLRSGFITSDAAAGADLIKLMEVSRHKKPETIIGYVRESKLFENHAGKKFLMLHLMAMKFMRLVIEIKHGKKSLVHGKICTFNGITLA